jgi:hypothetical protein
VAGVQQLEGAKATLFQLRWTTQWSWHVPSIANDLLLMRISVTAQNSFELESELPSEDDRSNARICLK